MRVKVFAITGELLEHMFLEGAKRPTHTIVQGWPKDCVIQEARMSPYRDVLGPVLEVLLEHETFPELTEGESIWNAPNLEVLVTTP